MPDETPDETPTESPNTSDASPPAPARRPPSAPGGLLSKDSDKAARPGFRSPSNKKSKAMRKKRKK